MRVKGKISTWNDDKGFGFIMPDAGGKQVFIHITAFTNRNRRPELDQSITYIPSSDKQGRPCAKKAILEGEQFTEKIKRNESFLAIVITITFIIIVGGFVLKAKIPPLVFVIYVVLSLFTFIVYGLDKSAAKRGAWRTQESTLHLLSLIGGWPGALIAQQKLHHKPKKQSFRFIFWITVLLNCGAFLWMNTSTDSTILQSLVGSML